MKIYGYIFSILFIVPSLVLKTWASDHLDICKKGEVVLKDFWDKLNNIKHGEILFINIKNYYCPACNKYMDTWNRLERDVLNFEKNVSMFVFDCSCTIFHPYCRLFQIKYFPTFRLLYPIYDKINDSPEYKYLSPNTKIGNEIYTGNLLLAYNEVERVNKLEEFQILLQTYLCNNVNFNNIDIKSCYYDILPPVIDDNAPNNFPFSEIYNNSIGNNRDETEEEKEKIRLLEKWNSNVNNKEYMKHDIIKGLLFTLKKNISLSVDISKETIEPYINMLQIVEHIYPDLAPALTAIAEKLESFNYPIPHAEWVKLVNKESDDEEASVFFIDGYDIDVDNVQRFKVCDNNSVLCTYWLLYHKISVYCLLHDKKEYSYYIESITNYTKNYLNCRNCISHFLKAQKFCHYGFCNIHSAESFVIFLWRIHNSVTLRTTYDHIISDIRLDLLSKSKQIKFLHKDIVFPSEKQCNYCRNNIGFTKVTPNRINEMLNDVPYSSKDFDAVDAFNIMYILQYLVEIYS
ncbi:conserved Plasmodium protein, unknown function [Plasmodium chabaudi chabaudi]|uniref:Sulfhydryl oxidase n=1 Tax=Plasmodium chabaudi chabaudi TaxID=31271 RepID=A0A1C6YU12_PLACU|nr:conserved Plasmodium protein, unknown function [Plasmodium chabaudi chabaudi]